MRKVIIAGLIVFTGLSACKSKKKTDEHAGHDHSKMQTNAVSESTAMRDSLNNFQISFISIGSGTDGKIRTQVLNYLDSFQVQKNISLTIESRPWGREGEVDYCIATNALTEALRTELFSNLSKMVEGNRLVRFQKNKSCSR